MHIYVYTHCMSVHILLIFFFFFGYTVQHVGLVPGPGLKLHPLQWVWSLNHWLPEKTMREKSALWFVIGCWIPFPVLYSRNLSIHSMYSSLWSTAISSSIPPPNSPFLESQKSVLYVHEVCFCYIHMFVCVCHILESTFK